MAGDGPQDLFATADELLAVCVESLDTIPDFVPGLLGAPERSYVSPGEPAADCCDPGQLTVHIVPLFQGETDPLGLAAAQRVVRGSVNYVGLIVTIFRCVPTPTPTRSGSPLAPSAESISASSEQIYADGWAIWNGVANRVRAGLFSTRCKGLIFDGLRVLTPDGACGGIVATFRLRVDGYEEVLS